jgi:CheY-like chemotaxis protein
MTLNAPEVLVVDDTRIWREINQRRLSNRGYLVSTATDSYDAIHQLAGRIHHSSPLPDIYLSDMLDRKNITAKIKVGDEMRSIWSSMAFNIHNYLKSQGITPRFLVGMTADICSEDNATAIELGIPLINKDPNNFDRLFPDLSALPLEERMKLFGENWTNVLGKRQ